jgi:chromosome partitioning protein
MSKQKMRIVAFAAQKGGSGKTTLAANVAVQAELNGDGPVALIDTDPQGSMAHWWQQREQATPLLVHAPVARLAEHIQEMRDRGVSLVVIDTPPAITSTIGHVINHSDLVVIPTRPSPHDLRAAGATVDIANRLDKPVVFVINGAHPRARITTEAAIALSQHGPLASVVIHQRTNFAASMIDGRTVLEVPGKSRSPGEIVALWEYLKGLLWSENRRRTARSAFPAAKQDAAAPMAEA